ncbi:MAG: hypothetical protein WCY09_05105 [Candidatus Omnitrophota bacterium]
MGKCTIAKLLREEIDNLTRIAEALEDNSKLCSPGIYDCSRCLGEVSRNLKRIKKILQSASLEDYRIPFMENTILK